MKDKEKFEGLREAQENMKEINKYYRKNHTLDGCILLTETQLKKLQEDNRDIPRQFTLAQATGQQRPPENETPVQPELQLERLFEALNKGERERVVKCDTRMAAYLISIRYRDVRIRNGHFNYQTGKEGIIFNPDDTMQHTLTWNELAEELVKRFGKKQKPVKMVS